MGPLFSLKGLRPSEESQIVEVLPLLLWHDSVYTIRFCVGVTSPPPPPPLSFLFRTVFFWLAVYEHLVFFCFRTIFFWFGVYEHLVFFVSTQYFFDRRIRAPVNVSRFRTAVPFLRTRYS